MPSRTAFRWHVLIYMEVLLILSIREGEGLVVRSQWRKTSKGISLVSSTNVVDCGYQRAVKLQSSKTETGKGTNDLSQGPQWLYEHALAILVMPYTSLDRIANEAILETVLEARPKKLSIVLRCEGRTPTVNRLRRYVGEIYSQLWDCCLNLDSPEDQVLVPDDWMADVVVYPQNLPNTPPESWLHIQPDLDVVCSHDSMTGWTSEMFAASTASDAGRGARFATKAGSGRGGLDEHVAAMNAERKQRQLAPVQALHVEPWPTTLSQSGDHSVIFLDDDEDAKSLVLRKQQTPSSVGSWGIDEDDTNDPTSTIFLGGPSRPQSLDPDIDNSASDLFHSVAVGGTFDGLHFGHRKLLTLAISSVNPVTGRLLVGVTVDDMLRKKAFAEYIPTLPERMKGVRRFLHRLAPGMINRIQIVPIDDAFGPPGQVGPQHHFDALVLSHETLETGYLLNRHRQSLGMKPLHLLCTRRTEAHGMSSTAIRRFRKQRQQQSTSLEKKSSLSSASKLPSN